MRRKFMLPARASGSDDDGLVRAYVQLGAVVIRGDAQHSVSV